MHSFRIVSFRFGVFLAVLPAHLFACLIELNELVEIHLCKKQKRQRETASCHQNQTNYAWMCMHPFYQDRHTHFLTAHTSNQFCTFDLNLYLVAHHKNAIKLLVQSSNRSLSDKCLWFGNSCTQHDDGTRSLLIHSKMAFSHKFHLCELAQNWFKLPHELCRMSCMCLLVFAWHSTFNIRHY